eukprot:TRINITY_DN2901_c0_g1_i2.p1 TRINITY_DN2901_c0_g1~~TRINITY_DN2901_c0_g1_i2.p1  ORF type:complete len:1343 (+),score=274.12 TRINITY_DN2901_c0_g1_i2:28-4056(+)
MWRRVVIIWFIVWVTEVRGLEQPPEYPVDDFNISSCEFDGPYAASTMTYFEKQCPLQNPDRNSTFCYCYLSIYDELNDHHDHDTVPYIIITIFASFAIGSFIRHMLSSFELRIPYTVILFIVGLGWGELSTVTELGLEQSVKISEMNPHLIFHIFLPVLIFESAFAMEIPVFKKVVSHCVTLAGPGLMVASALTAVTAKYLFTQYPWSWEACALFGTILSATDPVAVVALLKDLGASPIISTLIEGESLFNDGTAIVFFSVFEEAVEDGGFHKGIGTVLLQFLVVAFGGPLFGLIIGMITVASLNRVFNDPLIEVTLTIVAAYVTFFVCEGFFGVSGVLGVVTCGCFMSYYRHCISPEVVHTLHHFWEMTVYLTNTLIFILAGMIVALKSFKTVDGYDVLYLIYTYIAINVIRGFVLLLFNYCCFKPLKLNYQVDLGNGCLVAWGGLRGAVGLALALLIFENEKIRVVAPSVADKILFHTAGIVMLTLCVNGVTTQNVVSRFKLSEIEYRKRKRIHDIWCNLRKEQAEDYTDLGAEPLMYDADWKTVRRFSDLSTGIPDNYEDPYNPKGWYAKRDINDDDETVRQKEREEGKAAYLNTISASAAAQYKLGTLRRQGIREMTKMIVRARELKSIDDPPFENHSFHEIIYNSDEENMSPTTKALKRQPRKWTDVSLIQAEWINDLFSRSDWEKKVNVTPYIDEWLLRWRWQNAVDMALGFIQCHEVCRKKIRSLAEREVANQIDQHCKVTIKGIVTLLAKAARERPDISCSLKTRSACRKILNTMHTDVVRMQHDGRLDQEDAAALNSMIFNQMKKVQQHFKRTLQSASACELVESMPFFDNAERKSRNQILDIARDPSNTLQFRRNRKLYNSIDRSDLLLVISGVIQIRVGRKVFRYGSGYTAGWQMCLTESDRFSDVWSETATTVLRLPQKKVLAIIEEDKNFCREAWRCLGENAARILIALDDSFDPRVWDDLKIRKVAETGRPIFLQDPAGYEFNDLQQHKLTPDTYLCLLRGKAWEYGDERDHIGGSLCRFPTMIPVDFKFATFTNHAVMYEMDVELNSVVRARRLWGRLRCKVKSINLWSALRGPKIAKISLALALKRPPPPDLANDEEVLREMSEAKKEEVNRSTADRLALDFDLKDHEEGVALKSSTTASEELTTLEDEQTGNVLDPLVVEAEELMSREKPSPNFSNIMGLAPPRQPPPASPPNFGSPHLFGNTFSSPQLSLGGQSPVTTFTPLQYPTSTVFRTDSVRSSAATSCPLETALSKKAVQNVLLPAPPNFSKLLNELDDDTVDNSMPSLPPPPRLYSDGFGSGRDLTEGRQSMLSSGQQKNNNTSDYLL